MGNHQKAIDILISPKVEVANLVALDASTNRPVTRNAPSRKIANLSTVAICPRTQMSTWINRDRDTIAPAASKRP